MPLPSCVTLAAELAERAASVTHDGNGIYGGRFVAALVSAAFSEADPGRLIEIGLQHIPAESDYARVIRAMVDFHREHPADWHAGYAFLKANFGYDKYGGVVHIIPNAGIIALGLLYGEGDFSRSIRIANMGGWDTDCNVGNVGAIMGVAVGLAGIDDRWREPINDVLIAANLIGTRNILTIPQCADLFCHLGRQMNGLDSTAAPRYHFRYPGSANAMEVLGERAIPIHHAQTVVDGAGVMRVSIRKLNKKGELHLFTRTNYHPGDLSGNSYGAQFTPIIAPGQTIRARVYLPAEDTPDSVLAALFVYDEHHDLVHQAQSIPLTPGWHDLSFTVPHLENASLAQVGVIVRVLDPIWERGSICLESLDWEGAPSYKTTFSKERPETAAISGWSRWRGYWRLEDGTYNGSGPGWCESYSGDARWTDYRVSAEVIPMLGDYHQLNLRVQGALRSYAFGLAPEGHIALYKKDRDYQPVATAPFAWQHGVAYRLTVTATGDTLTAQAEGGGETATLRWQDADQPYRHGQVGFSTGQGGHTRYLSLEVGPA
jgi:hypothetical protein